MNTDEELTAEEKRLAQALAPFMEPDEEREVFESTEPAVTQEIESIIGIDDLTIAAQMQTRADIRAFLDQRMEPSAFITAVAERRVHAHRELEAITSRQVERLAIEG